MDNIPDALNKGGLSCALIPDYSDLGQWVNKAFNSEFSQTLNALDELFNPSPDDMQAMICIVR